MLRDLLEREVGVYGAGRLAAQGPDVVLVPEQALAMSMVIHELATNAAKHGAFLGVDGAVRAEWRVADGSLHFTWRETGGPPVTPPAERGFGLDLIEGQIVHQLDGSMREDYSVDGFALSLQFPGRN